MCATLATFLWDLSDRRVIARFHTRLIRRRNEVERHPKAAGARNRASSKWAPMNYILESITRLCLFLPLLGVVTALGGLNIRVLSTGLVVLSRVVIEKLGVKKGVLSTRRFLIV